MSAYDSLNRMRWTGLAEGASFLILLFVAMPLKYLAHMPMAVRIVGSVHGFLFIAYMVTVWLAVRSGGWPKSKALLTVVAAFFPFGPFLVDGGVREAMKPRATPP